VMKQSFTTIQEHLENKTWTDEQKPDLILALTRCETMISDVTSNLFLFINYFEQYTNAIYQSPLFGVPDENKNGNMSDVPTQTSAPANRAERRSKKKTPLEVVQEKRS
jgi:hypothetical protein